MCAPCKEAFEGGINPAIFDNSNPTGNDAKLKSYLLHTVKHRDLYAGLATLFNLKPYTYH
jgi:hypothetical protein